MPQQDTSASNRRIAKNATMLYIRMFVSMAISFYTSRIVLQALGISDYGIYNLIGGIIVLIGVISGALSGATSRFLTYSLGENDEEKLKRTFSTAFIIHCGLSILFLIIAETIGLWFVNTQLIIPAERMSAANWVYQSAVISTVFSITQVPYNSLLTSHERFGVFAYIDILNSLLKLGISVIVLYSTFDGLKFYSVLYVSVAIFIMMLNRFYCVHHFDESHVVYSIDRKLLKEMLTFSGWNLFNSASFTCYQQGQNILINRFFGVMLNAAAGVAFQVQAILYGFIGNISTAFVPQVIKSYANKDYSRVNYLIRTGGIFSSVFTLLISIPVFIKMPFLMGIWLKDVPEGAVDICKLLLIVNFFNCFNPLACTAINATGKNKTMNIICGMIYLAILPILYIFLKLFHSYLLVYALGISLPILTGISYFCILKSYMKEFDIHGFIFKLTLPASCIGIIALLSSAELDSIIHNNWLSFLSVLILSSIIVLFLAYYFLLNQYMKQKCVELIKTKLHI